MLSLIIRILIRCLLSSVKLSEVIQSPTVAISVAKTTSAPEEDTCFISKFQSTVMGMKVRFRLCNDFHEIPNSLG